MSMLIDRQYPEMTPYSVTQCEFNDNKATKQRNASEKSEYKSIRNVEQFLTCLRFKTNNHIYIKYISYVINDVYKKYLNLINETKFVIILVIKNNNWY